MCFVDSEGPRFYEQTERKARKEHDCCECGETIPIGAVYEYVAGYWEDFDTFKTCARCRDARERIAEFEMAAGCDEDEAFCPHRFIRETLHQHGLDLTTVFLPDAKEKYLSHV